MKKVITISAVMALAFAHNVFAYQGSGHHGHAVKPPVIIPLSIPSVQIDNISINAANGEMAIKLPDDTILPAECGTVPIISVLQNPATNSSVLSLLQAAMNNQTKIDLSVLKSKIPGGSCTLLNITAPALVVAEPLAP